MSVYVSFACIYVCEYMYVHICIYFIYMCMYVYVCISLLFGIVADSAILIISHDKV